MTENILGNSTLALLKRSLDAYTLRQKVIAENIAHAETPGYKSRSVQFEELLEKAMGASGSSLALHRKAGHLNRNPGALPVPRVEIGSDRAMHNGVNDVSLDLEMAALAETNLSHKMAARILALKYKGLRSAIRGQGQP